MNDLVPPTLFLFVSFTVSTRVFEEPTGRSAGKRRRHRLQTQVLNLSGDETQAFKRKRIALLPQEGPDLLELQVQALPKGRNGGKNGDQKEAGGAHSVRHRFKNTRD